jgi:hypothetical protein
MVGSPPDTADSPSDQDPPKLLQYSTFESLLEELESYSMAKIFQLCRNTRCNSNAQMEAEFGKDYQNIHKKPICRRGYFYCNAKGCEWRVQFRRVPEKNVYEIDPSLTQKKHNHVLKADLPRTGSSINICSIKECTSEEITFIMSLGAARLGVPAVKNIISKRFSGRVFDSALLHRILQKGFEAHYGTDPDCISKFMEEGYALRQQDGIFIVKMLSDARISEVFGSATREYRKYLCKKPA